MMLHIIIYLISSWGFTRLTKMQIIIPIADSSTFFPESEYYFPKPLVEVCGMPMIELVITNIMKQFPNAELVFVISDKLSRSYSLDATIKLASDKNATIISRRSETSGALCSCLLACDKLQESSSLLIINSDQVIDYPLSNIVDNFISNGVDAGTVTFSSVHPRWCYVLEGKLNEVQQLAEKQVISRTAIAGFYYFKNVELFLNAAKDAILKDSNINGQYYISSAINEIILSNGNVVHSPIPTSSYHSLYSPAKISEYETYMEKQMMITTNDVITETINLIIPAAGLGSRFANAGWKIPKPFIDVSGVPMVKHVINSLSNESTKSTIILRKEHIDMFPSIAADICRSVDNTVETEMVTEGTICTVLLARNFFDKNTPLMIANSDQYVNFDVRSFVNDCVKRKLDGSILVFRNPEKNPKWSFVKQDKDGLVIEVAEKKPISDLATVGIYFFSSGSQFVRGAIDMIAKNIRVNGEFYTCPVYNELIASGAKIGVYEIPSTSMFGLGTPEDLKKFLSINCKN